MFRKIVRLLALLIPLRDKEVGFQMCVFFSQLLQHYFPLLSIPKLFPLTLSTIDIFLTIVSSFFHSAIAQSDATFIGSCN